MKGASAPELDSLWARHNAQWRDTAQITSQWREANNTDPQLLRYTVRGDWWGVVEATQETLLITREYEHLVIALHAHDGQPVISYMPLPHPSGVAIDRDNEIVHIASTRNPNQIYDLAPVTGNIERMDVQACPRHDRPLVPIRSQFLPGSLYIHDLAIINGALHASAAGENSIVQLGTDAQYKRVWWPSCLPSGDGKGFKQNYIQLNSIAAGKDLASSYFSASTDKPSRRRPGHRNFAVDKRGVVFSGATREPIAWGLTRPHSARLSNSQVWVNNSGYGEVGVAGEGIFTPVARLSGWTRGLCFHQNIAFVGTSRVIPRFRNYAPGLNVDQSLCGVHAVDTATGKILGSILWTYGNQIFAVECLPRRITSGFPTLVRGKRHKEREKVLFYTFQTGTSKLSK